MKNKIYFSFYIPMILANFCLIILGAYIFVDLGDDFIGIVSMIAGNLLVLAYIRIIILDYFGKI